MRSPRVIPAVAIVVALFAIAAIGRGSVLAQGTDSTPSPSAGMEEAHPAHIHNGTCAELGSVAWGLNDVSAEGMIATPTAGTPMAMPTMPTGGTPMAAMGPVVAGSTTVVKVHLSDLEKAPFAINLHESAAAIQNYIACGDITGAITDGWLTITLNELNDSGFSGVAMLHDNGDGTTTVIVQLMKSKT